MLHLVASRQTLGQGGNGAFAQYAYDNNTHGNPQSQYRWDSTKAASQPTTLSASNAVLTSWTWDAYGNLKTITDPWGIQTVFGYDSQNYCLTSKTVASIRHFTYQCETYFGLRTQGVDADNQITTNYGYDQLGRPVSSQQSGGSSSSSSIMTSSR